MERIEPGLGQRLHSRRKELGYSLNTLQELTGIPKGNLSGYERSRYCPSAETLCLLSIALKCSVDWILTGKEFSCQGSFNITTSSYAGELLSLYDKMSDGDKQELIMIARIKANKS